MKRRSFTAVTVNLVMRSNSLQLGNYSKWNKSRKVNKWGKMKNTMNSLILGLELQEGILSPAEIAPLLIGAALSVWRKK